MIAEGFVKNGATVYIAARKESQLKEVNHMHDVVHLFILLPGNPRPK
jgi:hypothetical protein